MQADVHDHMEYILMSLDMFAGVSDNLINYTCNVCSIMPFRGLFADCRIDGLVRNERGHVSGMVTLASLGFNTDVLAGDS